MCIINVQCSQRHCKWKSTYKVNINLSTIDYSTLFFKLQKELPTEGTHEKPNLNRKIILITSQKNLLMYACFKEYNNLLEFATFDDCNKFVNKWATK
jgi:hypothetical protein